MRVGESVILGNRLDSPGEEMELFVVKAATCMLKVGASSSGEIVGVRSVAIIANLYGSRGPRCTDSWDPRGYGREGRDSEAEEPECLYQLITDLIWT